MSETFFYQEAVEQSDCSKPGSRKEKNSFIFCVSRADGMYADPEAECQVGGNEDDDLDEDDHEDDHEDGGDNDAFDGNDH